VRLLIKGFDVIPLDLIKGVGADMEAKYPGGHWVTERGRHVYIRKDGTPAPETAPAKQAKAKATPGETTARLQRLAERRGEPELAPDPKAAKKAMAKTTKVKTEPKATKTEPKATKTEPKATKTKTEKPGAQKAPAKAASKTKTALVTTKINKKGEPPAQTKAKTPAKAEVKPKAAPKLDPFNPKKGMVFHDRVMLDSGAGTVDRVSKGTVYYSRGGVSGLSMDGQSFIERALTPAQAKNIQKLEKAKAKKEAKPKATAKVKAKGDPIARTYDRIKQWQDAPWDQLRDALDIMKMMDWSMDLAHHHVELLQKGVQLTVKEKKALDTAAHRAERATWLSQMALFNMLGAVRKGVGELPKIVGQGQKPALMDLPAAQDAFGTFEAVQQLVRLAGNKPPKSFREAEDLVQADKKAMDAIRKYGPQGASLPIQQDYVDRMILSAYLVYEHGITGIETKGAWAGMYGTSSLDPKKYPPKNYPTGKPAGTWSPDAGALATAASGLDRLPSWMRLGSGVELSYYSPDSGHVDPNPNAYYSPSLNKMVFPHGKKNGMNSSRMENVYTHEYLHSLQENWLKREWGEFNKKAAALVQNRAPLTAHQLACQAHLRAVRPDLPPSYDEEWAMAIESMTNPFSHALVNGPGGAVDCPHPSMWSAASDVLDGEFGLWRPGTMDEIRAYWEPRLQDMDNNALIYTGMKNYLTSKPLSHRLPVPINFKVQKKVG
jgi:hypothetical protein